MRPCILERGREGREGREGKGGESQILKMLCPGALSCYSVGVVILGGIDAPCAAANLSSLLDYTSCNFWYLPEKGTF